MSIYLGEFEIDIQNTPYGHYTPIDWAMYFIGRYGQIDGSHHKTWVLDQVARVLKGSPVKVVEARWSNGVKEFRCTVEGPSKEYEEWVEMMLDRDEDGEPQYSYDDGTAP